MRSRTLASIILTLFLLIPGVFYWYFFHTNISSLSFHFPAPWQEYEILLEGKLEYTYLPLADKMLIFREKCSSECTLIVPPSNYNLTITSTWMNDVRDMVTIRLWTKQVYAVQVSKKFSYTSYALRQVDPILEQSLLNNANTHFWWKYRHIGTTSSWEYLTLREMRDEYSIGILSVEWFRPIQQLPFLQKNIWLDSSRWYIIIDWSQDDRFISSIDGKDTTVFPLDGKIEIIDYNRSLWKVQTDKGVYAYEGWKWKKNPRFTDYIDISDTLRIGYIDRKDSSLLELSNFPLDTSILLLIHRKTGESRTLRSWLDILGLYHHEWLWPVMLFSDATLGYLGDITY